MASSKSGKSAGQVGAAAIDAGKETAAIEKGSQPILYEKVEPFSKEKYEKLGLSRVDRPFGFAAGARAVPLTVNEFLMASHFFPIVFAGGKQPMPIAVLGLNDDENLFVNDAGEWDRFTYVPAYIRRYPFISATDDKDPGRMTLCIAPDAPMVTESPEHPFFQDGELSQFTEDSLEFCKVMQQQFDNTQRFVDMLNGLDLLVSREATVTPPGGDTPQPLASFIAVDEDKLNNLPADKFAQLREGGALTAIYAHLHSALNWQSLTMRKEARQAAA